MRNDPKIRRLISRYGLEGYGLYCVIVESITEKLEKKSPLPELEETCEDLAEMYKGNTARLNEIMSFMINQGLFDVSEITGRVTCIKIYKFIDSNMTRSKEIKAMISAFKDSLGSPNVQYLEMSETFTDSLGQSEIVSGSLSNRIVDNSIVDNSIGEHINSNGDDNEENDCVQIVDNFSEQNDFFSFENPKPKKTIHTPERIQAFINASAKLDCFPTERRLLANIGEIGKLSESLSYYTEDEIRQALQNYEKIYSENGIKYQMKPYGSIINFYTDGISKFIDSADPFKRYKNLNYKNDNHEMSRLELLELKEQAEELKPNEVEELQDLRSKK